MFFAYQVIPPLKLIVENPGSLGDSSVSNKKANDNMLPESSYSSNRIIQNKVVQDVTNLGGPNVIVLENAFNDTRY